MSSDLRTLALAATPGPWHQDDDEAYADALTDHQGYANNRVANCDNNRQNAAFIAAASPAVVLALLAVVDAARDTVDPEPCRFDHHGGCQEHGYLDGDCGQAALRAALARVTPLIGGRDEEVTRG